MRMIPDAARRYFALDLNRLLGWAGRRVFVFAAPGALALFFGGACLSSDIAETRALVQANPVYQLGSYAFDPTTTLIRRVGPAPEAVLAYIRELDGRPDYRSYRPTAAEMRLIRKSLDRLPPRVKRNLQRRGLGIYFVDDFLTSGMTDWAVAPRRSGDGRPEIYSYMIFHAKTLRDSMQNVLNQRESTCFRQDDSGVQIRVRVAGSESAFAYLLLHEAVHALDYSERISPYVETTVRPLQERVSRDTDAGALVDRVWADYRRPRAAFEFAGRERVSFYGFRDGPLLSLAEAPKLYQNFSKSGFVSLYGSQMWPEDLAELVSMYFLTEAVGRDYSIEISRDGKTLAKYEPLKFPAVQARTRDLSRHFY